MRRIMLTAVAAVALSGAFTGCEPSGPPGEGWSVVFADEFSGTSIDRDRWSIHSDAEGDRCLGNKNNQQLEWHTWDALSVADGQLTITARKNNPEPGYEWSSGLITTGQSCGHEPTNTFFVQPGDYIETRLWLPDAKGFWPSTWTWNGNGSNEQDTYEFYSDNHFKLYLSNHYDGSGCVHTSETDLTTGWHVVGQLLGPDATEWYLDGQKICTGGAYAGQGALLLDMFVYSRIPPDVSEETMQIDWVRVHRR